MIRVTTPTLTLTVQLYDLTGTDVLVTIKQGDTLLNIEPDSVAYDDRKSTIICTLTQEQTQLLQVGVAKVQVNFSWLENSEIRRLATKVVGVQIREQLFEEVVTA